MMTKKITYAAQRALLLMSFLSGAVLLNAAPMEGVEEMRRAGKTASTAGSSALGIVALLLAVVAVGISVFLFWRLMKSEEVNKKQLKALSEAKQKNAELEKLDKESLQNELARVRLQIGSLNSRIDQLQTMAATHPVPSAPSQPRTTHSTATNRTQSASVSTAASSTQNTNLKPRTIYVSTISGDHFTSLSDSYVPGKSLYVIETADGKTGKLSFLDKKEAMTIARRDTTKFIESVGLISGSKPDFVASIRTIKPGRVTASGNGWRLDEKALVELS